VLLRPGKTPSGTEIRGHLRRLVRRIRRHWPQTRITIRGDGHYGRPEVMEWCDENDIDFVFGLPGNTVLDRLVDATADDIRTRRALDRAAVTTIISGMARRRCSPPSMCSKARWSAATCNAIVIRSSFGSSIRSRWRSRLAKSSMWCSTMPPTSIRGKGLAGAHPLFVFVMRIANIWTFSPKPLASIAKLQLRMFIANPRTPWLMPKALRSHTFVWWEQQSAEACSQAQARPVLFRTSIAS
jgi:Transposase DDE domain group 1